MGRDRARRSPKKRGKFHNSPNGHLLYQSEANNGQAGVGFLVNKKWKDNITIVSSGRSRVAELVHNRYIPTEDRSSICANDISIR